MVRNMRPLKRGWGSKVFECNIIEVSLKVNAAEIVVRDLGNGWHLRKIIFDFNALEVLHCLVLPKQVT